MLGYILLGLITSWGFFVPAFFFSAFKVGYISIRKQMEQLLKLGTMS
jgi:hypothetical protein